MDLNFDIDIRLYVCDACERESSSWPAIEAILIAEFPHIPTPSPSRPLDGTHPYWKRRWELWEPYKQPCAAFDDQSVLLCARHLRELAEQVEQLAVRA